MPVKAQFPEEQSEAGEFERQEDAFRDFVSIDGSTPYPAMAGRYHLYISLACPWASRTLIVRMLMGLEDAVGMTVVDPVRDERGWAFRDGPGYSRDPINGFAFLSEAYVATGSELRWSRYRAGLVGQRNPPNCQQLQRMTSAGCLTMLSASFGNRSVDLFPKNLEADQAKLSVFVYEYVNNRVYRAGFASTQPAYEEELSRTILRAR